MARCTICHTLIEDRDERTRCEGCFSEYHASCWNELGGCGTYGCRHAAVAEKPAVPAIVGAGWGDTKPCPSCGASISASLLVCTCGAKFPWADPMTPAEYTSWQAKEQRIGSAKKFLIALFVGTLLGVTGPLTGPIAGLYAHGNRELLGAENGTYLALGYGSAALGAVHILIIALLALGL